jgi:hypothetical protein
MCSKECLSARGSSVDRVCRTPAEVQPCQCMDPSGVLLPVVQGSIAEYHQWEVHVKGS